jgi:lipopolysaccharide export system permease protein
MLLLLMGLEFFFSFVNEVRYVGMGEYQLSTALWVLILSLPTRVYQLFPMAVLVGALLGLGTLASHGELVAMRALGVSLKRIILWLLKVGFVLAVLVSLVGEWVSPYTEMKAQQIKTNAMSGGKALYTHQGVWMRSRQDFVHIDGWDTQGTLTGVSRYQVDDASRLVKSSVAASAHYQAPHWVLHNVKTTFFHPDSIQTSHEAEELWDSDISPEVLNLSQVRYVDELSLSGLWQAIQFRQSNDLSTESYRLALWQKLLQPFAVLVMLFLSAPGVFGPLRDVTLGARLLSGIALGFVFHTLNATLGPFILVSHGPVWVGALLPLVLFLSLGVFLFRRIF